MIHRCVVLFAFAGAALLAQTATSRLHGLITDSSGGRVPGATVTARHEPTGLERAMQTNASGQYAFDGMPLGNYTISAALKGFKTVQSSGNELQVGEPLTVDLTIEPGAASEQITVTEAATQVQVAEASIGEVIGNEAIGKLPLDGRNPLLLMALMPGVLGHIAQGTSFWVNGDRGRGVYTTLDGVDVTDPVLPTAGAAQVDMNPDSIGEYRVITSLAKAEYGRNSGAQVQMITPSGGNTFHGNLFEYNRNTAFNANDWFNNRSGLPRQVLNRNQFGASFSGPLRKNKLFFFFNWQSQRLVQSIAQARTVLTAEARRGMFRFMAGSANSSRFVTPGGQPTIPACGGSTQTNCYRIFDLAAGDPLGRGLDPLMQTQIKLTNLPNDFSVGDGFNTATYRFNAPSSTPADNYTGKLDYHLNSNHRAFLRWTQGNYSTLGDYGNSGLARYPANPQSYPGRTVQSDSLGVSLGMNSVISPSAVNEFNAGYTRRPYLFLDPTHPGIEIIENVQSAPFVYWGGSGRTPVSRQALDNFSFLHGSHTFKTGANFRWYSIDQFRRATNFYPRLTFGTANAPVTLNTNDSSPNLSLAGINPNDRGLLNNLFNDLMGVVGTVQKVFYSNGKTFPSAGNELKYNQHLSEYNFYFQDDWRIGRRLTINLGLRYEFNTVPVDSSGLEVVNEKPLDSRTGDVALVPAGPGTGRSWYRNDYKDFAPMVGFAWTPFNGNKTVIRGGYRIAYNRLDNWILTVVEQNEPSTTRTSIIRPNPVSPVVRASDVGQSLIAQLSDGVVGQAVPRVPPPDRSSNPLLLDQSIRTPYVNQWNFSIQREMFGAIVQAAYVGNEGVHLFRMLNVNQATVTPDFLAGFKAAQTGVRTGVVGKLLDTYGSTLPSSVSNMLATNGVGDFISAVDTGVFNGVVGGRLIAAGLPQGYFRNPQFGIGALGCTCSTSSYNALQISLNRRFSKGLMVQANYTWSKSLDDISDDTNGAGTSLLIPRDSTNVRLDRGPSAFNMPRQLRAAMVYELPLGKGKPFLRNGAISAIVGGWVVSAMADRSTGFPGYIISGYSTLYPGVISNADFSGNPNKIGSVVKGGSTVTFVSAAEKAQFSLPRVGDLGSGRNIFTAPGFFQMDLALHKVLPIKERFKLELRAEAFNVWNRVNFAPPNVNLSSPSFGVIASTASPPRIMQFAARISF